MAESSTPEHCDQCGNQVDRIFSPNIQFLGASVKDAEYYPSFGKVIKNDYQRKEEMKRHNVIEVGNEKPTQIRHYTERYRKAKLAADYED